MTATHPFDNRLHFHRPSSSTDHVDRSHHRHRPPTWSVPSRINGLEPRPRFTKSHSSVAVGLSSPPLIHPVRHSTPPAPINNGHSTVHSPHHAPTEHSNSPSTEICEPCKNSDQSVQSATMAPKRTRASAKAQELQAADSPLLQRLRRIQNAKATTSVRR